MRPPITTTQIIPPKPSATPSANGSSSPAPKAELPLSLTQTEQNQLKTLLENWPKQKVSGTVVESKEHNQQPSSRSDTAKSSAKHTTTGKETTAAKSENAVKSTQTQPKIDSTLHQTSKTETTKTSQNQPRLDSSQLNKESVQFSKEPQVKVSNSHERAISNNAQTTNGHETPKSSSEQKVNTTERLNKNEQKISNKTETTATTQTRAAINNDKTTHRPQITDHKSYSVELKLPNKQTVNINLQQALPSGAKVELSLNRQGSISLTSQDKAVLSALTGKSSDQIKAESTRVQTPQLHTTQPQLETTQTKPVLSSQKNALVQMIAPLLKQSLSMEQPLAKTFTALSQLASAHQSSASSPNTASVNTTQSGNSSLKGSGGLPNSGNSDGIERLKNKVNSTATQTSHIKNSPQVKQVQESLNTPNKEVNSATSTPKVQGQPLNQTMKALNQVLNLIQHQSNLTSAQAVKTALLNSGLFTEPKTSPVSLTQTIRHLSQPLTAEQASTKPIAASSTSSKFNHSVSTSQSKAVQAQLSESIPSGNKANPQQSLPLTNKAQSAVTASNTNRLNPAISNTSGSSSTAPNTAINPNTEIKQGTKINQSTGINQSTAKPSTNPNSSNTVSNTTVSNTTASNQSSSNTATSSKLTPQTDNNTSLKGQGVNQPISLKNALLATLKIALAESQQLNSHTRSDSSIDKNKSLTIDRIVQQLLKPDVTVGSEKEKLPSLAAKVLANLQATQIANQQSQKNEVNQHLKQAVSPDLFKAISLYSAMLPGQDKVKAIEADNPVARLFQLLLGALGKAQASQLHTLQQQTVNQDPQLLQTWTFEVPFHQNDRYQSCDLTIEQYKDSTKENENRSRNWRILLGFELDDMGDLFIELNLKDEKASSQIWANNKTAYESVKAEVQFLRDSLTAVGVEVTSIDCHHGEPPDRSVNWDEIDDQIVDLHT